MEDNRRDIMLRFFWVYGIILLGFIVVIGKIAFIQIVDGSFWKKLEEERYVELRPVKAKRGSIFSVDSDSGELLMVATDVPKYDVYIDLGYTYEKDPKTKEKKRVRVIVDSIYKRDMPILCDSMGKLFYGQTGSKTKNQYKEYLNKYRRMEKGNRYVLLQKNITLEQWERFRKFPLISREKVRKSRQTGKIIHSGKFFLTNYISVVERNVRYYPYYPMARRTIGVPLSGCDTCYDGIDGYYSNFLAGETGIRKERKINPGIWIPVDDNEQIKAIDGHDIVTTIDVRLQELAENSLRKCLDSNDAKSGCVILMEVKTGAIRAISSLQKNKDGVYAENTNIAISSYFEPGSTFKAISAMLYLDKGMIDSSSIVPTFDKRFVGARTNIKDVGRINYGNVSFARAMEMSSNVGLSQVVFDNYIAKNRKMQFGKDLLDYFYYDRLNMDIKIEEPKPYINEKGTSVDDILRLSFGYVTAMTPMQLLTFYNGIANNGVMVKPMFVSDVLKDGQIVKTFKPVVIKEKMCKKETLDVLQDILKRVVENGTGRRLSKTSYGIAGKTGTAEIGYSKKGVVAIQHRASFAGYFPTDDPQYSCIVVVSEPQKNATHGGDLAAPVFRDLSDRVVGTRITYKQKTSTLQKQSPNYISGNVESYNKFCQNLGLKKPNTISTWQPNKEIITIPNVIGMTIRDAKYLLEKQGLIVSFEGKGKVVSQSISAGTGFAKGNKIHLNLN
ncbi:MAG: penicillin-binding protein [Bacteroidales bacterium]|mgnify:CR=1 FL=1|jgi:cell division protein FtsI (penicillin-binding protein 3)|nr:penicillin-binding protein [Bacteroidales bacterium]MDD4703321.1 penicillin-binding protein [Bacteroidales bacterium]MDX9798318.1 penicillin-binding protein [Bacteroidales bacterium]